MAHNTDRKNKYKLINIHSKYIVIIYVLTVKFQIFG